MDLVHGMFHLLNFNVACTKVSQTYFQRCWIKCLKHSKLVAQNSVPSTVLGQQKTDKVDSMVRSANVCLEQ